MTLQELKEQKYERILCGMIEYMNFEDGEEDEFEEEEFDAGYTQEDIDKCSLILDQYIDALEKAQKTADLDTIMKSVETVVKELNQLNVSTDHSLIETDQREVLCPFIQEAAVIAGLVTTREDITEEWREW